MIIPKALSRCKHGMIFLEGRGSQRRDMTERVFLETSLAAPRTRNWEEVGKVEAG